MSKQAKALYAYQSNDPTDLNFEPGDVIQVVESDPSGWWVGTLNNKTGQFPGAYVVELFNTPTIPVVAAKKRKPPPPPVTLSDSLQDTISVKVLWDYEARAEDEGSAQADDVFQVTPNEKSSDWWTLPNGKIFPKNYTEVIENQVAAAFVPPPPPPLSSLSSHSTLTTQPPVQQHLPGLVLGKHPIWLHPSYIQLMADQHQIPNMDRSFASFLPAITLISTAFHRLLGDAVNKVKKALEHASFVAKALPLLAGDCSEPLYLFLFDFVNRVKSMQVGDMMILPSGYHDGKTQSTFVSVLSLESQEFFSFSMVPPLDTEAQGYHPSTFDTVTSQTKFEVLHFANIPRFRLVDSSFWFMFFRLIVFPHEGNTLEHLYQVLLPSLNHIPLRQQPNSRVFVTCRPEGGQVHLIKKAVHVSLALHGPKPTECKRVLAEFRYELMKLALSDFKFQSSEISQEERLLLRLGLDQLANAASKLENGNPQTALEMVSFCQSFYAQLGSSTCWQQSLPLECQGSSHFSLFDRFKIESVEHLAGTRTLRQIQRPVQISLVPSSVANFADVALALRHCLHVCTLLDNQQATIKNTVLLRVAMMVFLFTQVIPLPCSDASVCFWRNQPMRYETQVDLLKLLEQVARHFSSASLSLHVSRAFDAQRIVTMAAIATLGDVVARTVASDIPSQFSLHLSGRAPGPVQAFGFEIGYFLEESGFLEFAEANLCATRTLILDYFASQNIAPQNLLFRFEQSMEFSVGDDRLVDQLCLQMGFPRSLRGLSNPLQDTAKYLTGENPVLIDLYPELALYRDLVFLFKMLLSPSAGSLPPVKAWLATDAQLSWSVAAKAAAVVTKKDGKEEIKEEKEEEVYSSLGVNRDTLPRPLLSVSGFGQKQLKCSSFSRTYVSNKQETGAFKSFLGFFGLSGKDRPRAPPSGANPSNLVNEAIVTEDDVLHVRNLPDFKNRLGARDCELLLSYLTAPYLRIPLVLQFFAEESRINCLASSELQSVLDSCLFEPSLFQAEVVPHSPEVIPTDKREELATSCGLLFNELQKCPHVVLTALEKMVYFALELDVGKFSPVSSAVLLYVSRLMGRVLGYIDFICENAQCLSGDTKVGRVSQVIRGVGDKTVLDLAVWDVLDKFRVTMRRRLEVEVCDTMETWLQGAMKVKDVQLACILHAHKAMLFQGCKELGFKGAVVSLAAFVFVTSNFRFTADSPEADEESLKRLGVNQMDLFLCFQALRVEQLKFFAKVPEEKNRVMEAVVRLVTLTIEDTPVRNWVPISEGRFVPDTEIDAYQQTLASLSSQKHFEEWLRQTTTLAVDTEINIQLGEFTLKKNHMQLLPDEFFAFEDFQHIFGKFSPQRGDALQCAEVSNTSNRSWFRLVGKRHDVQLWKPDLREIPNRYGTGLGVYPDGCKEKWVGNVLEPFRVSLFPDCPLTLVSVESHVVRLLGSVIPGVVGQPMTPLEIVVFRSPPLVHVYYVVEFGRRFLPVMAFSSDACNAYGEFHVNKVCLWPPQLGLKLAVGKVISQAFSPAPSLVITRNLTSKEGTQIFIPPKFLFGLIPHCLLEQYDFWQSETHMTGVPKKAGVTNRLHLSLGNAGGTTCQRISQVDGQEVVHVLLNPLFATPGSALQDLGKLFMRVDNLSHILMWSTTAASGNLSGEALPADVIELPRARLTFTRSKQFWFLQEHAGLFISTNAMEDASMLKLLHGLPCGLVLENDEQEYFLLLPATCRVTRQFRADPEAAPLSSLLADFSHQEWISNLSVDIRHYLLPVHASRAFVFTPTLASALFLLVLRFACRRYSDAFVLAPVCVSDVPLTFEENQLLMHLKEFAHDHHPDAHAVRLRISIATIHTSLRDLPWNVDEEYGLYCTKFLRVSAMCRLTVEEELSLERTSHWNRQQFLSLLQEGAMESKSALKSPLFVTGFPQFDAIVDKTALEDRAKASSWKQTLRKFSSAKPMTYSRPDEVMGAQALRLFEKFVREGVSIRSSIGFVFMFELMTGTLALRILPEDSCFNWGVLFLRRLPSKKFVKQQTMTSVLRIMSYNPSICSVMPKYEDNRKHKISIMFKGSNAIQGLLENCNQFLRAKERDLVFPKAGLADIPNSFPLRIVLTKSPRRSRVFELHFRIVNHGCHLRKLSLANKEFANKPLFELYSRFVEEKSRQALGMNNLVNKNLNVSFHPSTRSRSAKQVLERIALDDACYCEEQNTVLEPTLSSTANLTSLQDGLKQLISKDSEEAKKLIDRVISEANSIVPVASNPAMANFLLRKMSGQEVALISFDFLVGLTMCSGGDQEFNRWQPFKPFDTESLETIMFRLNRVKQSHRALKLVSSLLQDREEITRKLTSESLARELAASRHYVSQEYDPRFLAFEFTNGILLRKAQIELVRDFIKALRLEENRAKAARVHQMLMGGGKTTVIGPLLSLLLGTQDSLVFQVVPQALLFFSRSVMRECFSSPIFAKPVYTFDFNRVSEVSRDLVKKLQFARRSKSVVCTTPAALKSFFLKLLEAAHLLDNARVMNMASSVGQENGLGILSRSVFGFSRVKRKPLEEAEKQALVRQLHLGVEVLEVFRSGKLLLDEVDLILHPLKSELNWPIGLKLPLDFTASKQVIHGLRWQVPFYLLDAIFYCDGLKRLAFATDDSREAQLLLENLSKVVQEGMDRRLVQKQPHLVILSRLFYSSKMKPLLGRWLVLFIIQKGGVRGVRDDVLTSYVLTGPKKAPVEVLRMLKDTLPDEHFKLLNLAHDWLETFCPFCISRINRVKFGLLGKEHWKPLMPKNRKLLAVPFVGKDVPSDASEFAHPDILLGLTTMAYRLEGLRFDDFVVLIRVLKERLEEEHGVYATRPTARLYIKWIELAGGRVRGASKGLPTLQDMWPLQLMDVNDTVQMDAVFALIRRIPEAALVYLGEIVLPETMQFQGLKLSACGQDLGGTMLFPKRIGFSGTPSDLLPVELGKCYYERGSDGKMIHHLSDPAVCTLRRTSANWTVDSLLANLCEVDAQTGKPIYAALIDTGALITGLSNEEVAAFMLKNLPRQHVDGVVYLDAQDRKMVVTREKTLPLDRCDLALSRRFSFYDQVHTTGMDLKQPPNGRAALTLGKDMVFRDYAQGAFRMRQLGKGQTIEVILIPEVEMLMQVQCASGRGIQLSGPDLDALLVSQRALPTGRILPTPPPLLLSIVSWLVINTCIHEKVQFNLLSEQSCNNVWRKRAFSLIESKLGVQGKGDLPTFTQEEVDVFREAIDFSVEHSIPQPKSFVAKLEQQAREKLKFLTEQEDRLVLEALLVDARESESRDAPTSTVVVVVAAGVEGDGSPEEVAKERAFNSEQVQEQEAEQEVEVEEQQEKEEERMEEDLQEEFVKKKYARDDESAKPWRLSDLTTQTSPFVAVSTFAVHKTILESIKPQLFPEPMLLSRNYYEPKWTLYSFRRIKNVICMLEYYFTPDKVVSLPDVDPITLRKQMPLDEARMNHIKRAFGMFDLHGNQQLNGKQALEVVQEMDVNVELAHFAQLQQCFVQADRDGNGMLNFAEFLAFLQTRQFYNASATRKFVAISLSEAETLRRILHTATPSSMFPLQFAIHSVSTQTVLDCSQAYAPCSEYQQEAYYSLFRFLDSEVSFSDRSCSILIRCLQENACKLRQTWFEDVRECRRRPRRLLLANQPVYKVLTTPHEFVALEYRATIVRIRGLIYQKGFFVLDAFRLFDTNRDGLLSCSELNAGLSWLGMTHLSTDQIYAIVRALDTDKDGQLNLEDFKRAFGDTTREEQIARAGQRSLVDFDTVSIPSKPVRELFETDVGSANRALLDVEIPLEALEKFRIKLKPSMAGLDRVWSSAGSLSEMEASIWKIPEEGGGGMLRSNRVQICCGQYATKGQDRPGTSAPGGGGGGSSWNFFSKSSSLDAEVTTIEIKDESRWGVSGASSLMKPLVEKLFPHPVRFQQLWGQPRGSPLFAWRGVSPNPNKFIFLGCVMTTEDEAPSLTEYRCVPKHWCVKVHASTKEHFIWKDSSATGGKKGSIWQINNMGLCWVNEGHTLVPPDGGFWELKQRAFHLTLADFDLIKEAEAANKAATLPSNPPPPVLMQNPATAAPKNVVIAEDPSKPSLDAKQFRAPIVDPPKLSQDRFPLHLFPTQSTRTDLRKNVALVYLPPKKVNTAMSTILGDAPPPPRPKKSSTEVKLSRPPPPVLDPAAVLTPPPRPPPPAAVFVAAAAAAVPPKTAESGSLPPPRPLKLSSSVIHKDGKQ